MGYTEEITKTAEYTAVSTLETPPEANTKMFQGAAAVGVPAVGTESTCSKGKKMKKKRRGLFMCCSNMEFENEEEMEKALAALKGGDEKRKLGMVMCCSNFQVGESDGFLPRRIAK